MQGTVNVNVTRDNIMLIQRKLISVYDYELNNLSEPFYFRLEIHEASGGLIGTIFRLDRYRLLPTFSTNKNEESNLIMDDALFFIKDEFIDSRDLIGNSEDEIISIFLEKLNHIFNYSSR